MATDKTKAKIVDALLGLLAERDFAAISLGDVAKAADIPLGTLREAFEGRRAILAEFGKQIDRAVLAGGASDEATARERLFEVMMRRFDALRPYRAGVRGLARSARRDPALAAVLCRNAQVS
ncbi:MAG: TetR/AcrR family transcriptional regulator, partial [Bauldia sp.]